MIYPQKIKAKKSDSIIKSLLLTSIRKKRKHSRTCIKPLCLSAKAVKEAIVRKFHM